MKAIFLNLAEKIFSPASIDAWLIVFCASFVFMQGYLSSDDSYKYCNAIALFWIKFLVGSLAASCLALKSFRSTSYAESRKNGNGNGHVEPPKV